MAKNDTIKPLELKGYEALIYAIMKSFEKDGTKPSLENIQAQLNLTGFSLINFSKF